MSNKWNDSVDALKARIAEALASPEPPSAQQASDIGELLERINTYHQELEFQNDELTRIRQDLEDSRFRYQDLYYNGPIAYVTCNQDLEILTLNREFSLMTGIETFSRKGDPLTKYIHPDSQDIFHFHVRALLGGPGPQTCQLVLRGEERDIPVRLESNLLSNGDGYLIRSAVIDQTAEQAAEATANRLTQELKASNERLALQNTQLETYRRQLEATMLAGNIAWWEMDVKSGAVRFNEQKARLIGRNPAEFVHYTDFTTLVHPADLEPMMENMRRYLRGESVAYAVDYRIRHFNGSWKWFQDIGVASTVDANGLPLSLTGVVIDITSRKTTEWALGERIKELRSLYAITRIIEGAASDIPGLLRQIVATIPPAFQYPEQTSARIVWDGQAFTTPNWSEGPRRLRADMMSEAGVIGEIRVDYQPGALLLDEIGFLSEESELLWAMAEILAKTITRNQAQADLVASEFLFRSYVENAPDAVFIANDQGRYTLANKAASAMTGYSRDELLAMNLAELVVPEDIPLAISQFGQLQANGEFSGENRFRTRDGQVRHWNLKAVRLPDGQNLAFARDVTEWKAAQQALVSARQEAESASRAKSEFLANMSHEIRTPLNGIIGFNDLLLKTELNAVQAEFVRNTSQSARSLLAIISDILDLSKIEAGRMELEELEFDLHVLAAQAMDLVSFNSAQKDLELVLDIRPGVPRFITTDPLRLKQVLMNLLGNAVKFTRQGEVVLVIRHEDKGSGTGVFHFLVRDTGIGISVADRAKLFKAFSQADTSTTRKFGGTGLGLVISNHLLGKMGTELELESEPGKGSQFSFRLEKPWRVEPEQPVIGGRAVLCCNNRSLSAVIRNQFESWGIQCAESLAAQPEAFLAAFGSAVVPDIMVMEIPGSSTQSRGEIMSVLRVVRQSWPDLACLLLHSPADATAVHQAIAGLDRVYPASKPFKPDFARQVLLHLRLPDAHADPAAAPVADRAGQPLLAGNTLDPLILVAEDVPLNMVLVKAILAEFLPKARILEAVNGEEAVDLFRHARPDMIFMDIQMPLMDGYAVAREIRRLEGEVEHRVPVIALTANVVSGEREKCQEAGMDDYLAKPINAHDLEAMLLSYLGGFTAARQLSASNREYAGLHHDLEYLRAMLGSDGGELNEIYAQIGNHLRQDIENLEKAIRQGAIPDIRRTAHKVCGAALSLHCGIMADLARELEQATDLTQDFALDLLSRIWEENRLLMQVFGEA